MSLWVFGSIHRFAWQTLMWSHIWSGRIPISICLLYFVVLVVSPQSIEFFRFVLTEQSSFSSLLWQLCLPSAFVSLSFLASLYISNTGADAPRSRYLVTSTLLGAALSAVPFLAAALAVQTASVKMAAEPQELAEHLAFSLCLIGALSPILIFAISRRALPQSATSSTASLLAAGALWVGALLCFLLLATTPLFLTPTKLTTVSQSVGPLGLLAIFGGLLSIMLSGAVRATRGTHIPTIGLIALLAIALGLTGWNNNHAIRLHGPSPTKNLHNLDAQKFKHWLDSRSDRSQFADKPYPVFIVAAQGGGIYAAYHTAAVLTAIQELWPDFSQHLFAISSVSGGSLGSTFHLTLSQISRYGTNLRCGGRHLEPREIVDRFFSNDFLSPVLFMALFPDFAQRFWFRPIESFDRALGLEHAIETAWAKLAQDLSRECQWPENNVFSQGNLFARPLSDVAWTPKGALPVLYLNATDEESGQPIAISTVKKTRFVTSIWDIGLASDLNLSTAAVLSARFPYITPFGWFDGQQLNWYAQSTPLRFYLGDGGYYDNSGAELLSTLALTLKNFAARDGASIDVHSIILGDAGFAAENFIRSIEDLDDPGKTPPDVIRLIRSRLETFKVEPHPIGSTPLLAELWAPVRALTGSRQHRSKEAVKSLLRVSALHPWRVPQPIPQLSIFNDYSFVFPLGSDTPDMPLGWLLSAYTRQRLALRVGVSGDCYAGQYPQARLRDVNQLGEFMERHSEDIGAAIDNFTANCSLKRLQALKVP